MDSGSIVFAGRNRKSRRARGRRGTRTGVFGGARAAAVPANVEVEGWKVADARVGAGRGEARGWRQWREKDSRFEKFSYVGWPSRADDKRKRCVDGSRASSRSRRLTATRKRATCSSVKRGKRAPSVSKHSSGSRSVTAVTRRLETYRPRRNKVRSFAGRFNSPVVSFCYIPLLEAIRQRDRPGPLRFFKPRRISSRPTSPAGNDLATPYGSLDATIARINGTISHGYPINDRST